MPCTGPGTSRRSPPASTCSARSPSRRNADEARLVRDAAAAAGVHAVEAFHYAYHPLMARMLELAGNGDIGDLQYVEARMLMPPPAPGDLRWDASVAGGGLMDVGCYAVHAVRDFATTRRGRARPSSRPAAARSPSAPVSTPGSRPICAYPNGMPARIESSMTHGVLDFSLRLVGSNGEAYRARVPAGTPRRPHHRDRRHRPASRADGFAHDVHLHARGDDPPGA